MTHSILGARAQIVNPNEAVRRAREWAQPRGVDVLLVDARVVFGKDHLESAVRHAERARVAMTMTARSVAMESLLYLSGQRQVSDALRVAGIRSGTDAVGIAVFGSHSAEGLTREFGWIREDAVLDPGQKSLRALGVTELEETTVAAIDRADLALERTALRDVLQ